MIKKQLVVKSNKLIQASYRLSLTEQRIILYAIAKFRKLNQHILATEKVIIDPYEFAQLYDINPKFVYVALKEATNDLFKREVTIHDFDQNGKPIIVQTRWIWERGHSDDLNYSHIKFSPRVIGYFHDLEKTFGYFTKYSIESIASLNSIYAVRLYELLKQFQSVKYRDITITDLRNLFQFQDEYQILADLKKRVIDSSIKQINSSTDIRVSYTQIKRGRTIIGFKFKIDTLKKPKKKEEGQKSLSLETIQQSPQVVKQIETLNQGIDVPTKELEKMRSLTNLPSIKEQMIPFPHAEPKNAS
jgi:plasmid replication initiation protein